jgi:hypothetical protein
MGRRRRPIGRALPITATAGEAVLGGFLLEPGLTISDEEQIGGGNRHARIVARY